MNIVSVNVMTPETESKLCKLENDDLTILLHFLHIKLHYSCSVNRLGVELHHKAWEILSLSPQLHLLFCVSDMTSTPTLFRTI